MLENTETLGRNFIVVVIDFCFFVLFRFFWQKTVRPPKAILNLRNKNDFEDILEDK